MSKTMAIIENEIVVNVVSCSDLTNETDTLKDIAELPVMIGDTCSEGKYYRNGEQILNAYDKLAMYESAIDELYQEVAAE